MKSFLFLSFFFPFYSLCAETSSSDYQTLEHVSPNVLLQEEFFKNVLYPGCYIYYQKYFFVTAKHGVCPFTGKLLKSGSYLVLNNRSVWKMAESDFWKISSWETSDSLQLTQNLYLNSPFPYVLYNPAKKESIRARIEVGPPEDSPLFLSLLDRHLLSREVLFNNGTMWRVALEDCPILEGWSAHDVMMIGVNKEMTCLEYPYLLINFTKGSCCHALWLH